MKTLIALMVLSTALTANSAEKFAEITKGTTITLTTLPCTMYEYVVSGTRRRLSN